MPATKKPKASSAIEPQSIEPQSIEPTEPIGGVYQDDLVDWQSQYDDPPDFVAAIRRATKHFVERVEFYVDSEKQLRFQRELRRILLRLVYLATFGLAKEWPRQTWKFMETLEVLCETLDRTDYWWDGTTPLSEATLSWFPAQLHHDLHLEEPDVPQPQQRILESLESLVEQGLTNHQIASLADWKVPGGGVMAWDHARVARARSGLEEWPTHLTLEPQTGTWPERQPPLNWLEKVSQRLLTMDAIRSVGLTPEEIDGDEDGPAA